jgi:glycosyltransferase involved in cell wall biosynthesis
VILVPAEDVNALARAAEHLLADTERRKRLGIIAARLYRGRFDAQHTIATLRGGCESEV